jgi:pyruvate/2-oxoglutarate dehydrogenase complex dihydrolipoamide dehydrogenase (E3) component
MEREDEDVALALQEVLEGEGIRFLLSTQAQSVSHSGDVGYTVEVLRRDNGEQVELNGSHLLLAAGTRPNSDALNLEAAGIVHERGWIGVDDYLETNVPGVYALGDVKGGPAFTHISYNDFIVAYHNLFHEEKKSIRDRLVPYALYTDPELGRVGMTEREARESGRHIKVGRIPMSQVARAVERNETAGLMKIVVDAETECVLGAAILGVEGGELVQTLMTLMLAGASWKVLQGAIFIHPTLTEGFFGLMDSIE